MTHQTTVSKLFYFRDAVDCVDFLIKNGDEAHGSYREIYLYNCTMDHECSTVLRTWIRDASVTPFHVVSLRCDDRIYIGEALHLPTSGRS